MAARVRGAGPARGRSPAARRGRCRAARPFPAVGPANTAVWQVSTSIRAWHSWSWHFTTGRYTRVFRVEWVCQPNTCLLQEAQSVFSRVAIVNRGEAAMRLIHAVRDLSAETGTRIETVALLHRRRPHRDVRPRGGRRLRPRPRLGPPVPRPRRAGARAGRDRRRRRVGRLGLRRRGPGVRRAVRADRRHLRRPERRRDAQARRQDRREADRRGGRRPGRAVEPRRGRDPRRRRMRAGGRDRLPADAQGDRGRRRARHPGGHATRPSWPTPTSAPARRPRARSAAAWCSWSAWSPAPGTSRSRSSPTGRAPRGRWACATARCSGATRRSSRSPPRRCWRRSRPPS